MSAKHRLNILYYLQMANTKLCESDSVHLKRGLSKTYKERFEMITLLYKTHRAMNKFVISNIL